LYGGLLKEGIWNPFSFKKGISFLKGVGSHFKIPRFRSAPYKRGRYVAALLVALLVRYSCVTRCVTRHLYGAIYARHDRDAALANDSWGMAG